jgi:putative acetyltransferase
MKTNIRIREAVPEDHAEVTAFAFGIMRSVGIEPDPDNIDSALAKLGKTQGSLSRDFVAVDRDRPVGAIILKRISPVVGEVTGFYVRPEYQGQGIGQRLLNTALSAAGDAGYEQLVLTTNKNLTVAISLYESCGWVRQPGKPDNGADYLYALDMRRNV